MDQVKAFFLVLWQQRFWVLTFTGVLIAALCWMMGANDLQDRFSDAKGNIDTKFTSIESIKNTPYHGNDAINEKDAEELLTLRKSVMKLWEELYELQRSQVLKWPPTLGNDFAAAMEGKPFGATIKNTWRRRYLDYIQNRFEGLLEIVDAKNEVGDGARGAVGGMRGMGGYGREEFGGAGRAELGLGGGLDDEDQDYLVRWLDQAQVAQKMQFPKVPSSKQIWVTQEDLWVYETLLKVIAETNKARGATRPDNTAVRAIVSMNVGQDAAMVTQQSAGILMPSGAAGGIEGDPYSRGGGEDFAMEGGRGMSRDPYGMGGEGEFGEDADAALLSLRYVDETGAPVEAASIDELPAKFRRLPMRMVLMMDEKYLPKVMVECANADLPVEITRVRINPQASGAGFSSGGMGGGRGRSMGGYERMSPRGLGSAVGVAPTGLSEVELHGVVYIYNQPDNDELPAVDGDDELDADVTTEELAVADDDGAVG